MKISVITPSFNQGCFIERTLRSVAVQREFLSGEDSLEHVVYDGGSHDETVSILQGVDFPLTWVSEPDEGQTDAVNKGIAATTGEIIGWLNSDDVYYPNAVARVLDFFKKNPDVDVVYGQADHIDEDDKPFEDYPTEPWNYEQLIDHCFICQPALFFRRRVVLQQGLLDDALNYCMDYEYWLRLGKAGVRFAYMEEKLAGSRLYADNKTLGARVKVHHEINDMLKRHLGKVPDRWLFNYAHAVVESTIRREERPKQFVIKLLSTSLYASWHWNRAIRSVLRSPLIHWTRSLPWLLKKIN